MALSRNQIGLLANNDISIIHGDAIDEKREFDGVTWKKPEGIYFVYLRVNDDQSLFAEHYRDNLKGRTVEQAEEDLFKNARPFQGTIRPILTGFDLFNFPDEPCYISMVIDEPNWHFYPHPIEADIPAVILRRNKVIQKMNGDVVIEEYDPNYSFYNYEKTKIKAPDGHHKSAIRFVNFFKKDKFGNDEYVRNPEHDVEEQKKQNRYSFDIYIRMPIANAQQHNDGWATVIFDPPTPPRG
jgi:hypothetical protein